MSKQKSDFKNGTKQNKPYYIGNVRHQDNMIIVDEQIKEQIKENFHNKGCEKFKINRLKDNNVLLSIDGERPHIILPNQLFALTLACINLSKSVIPDCSFDRILYEKSNTDDI